VRGAVSGGSVRSAHDIAEGGLAVALAECCVAGGLGALLDAPLAPPQLFAEAPGTGFVLSGDRESLEALPGARIIGRVEGAALRIATHAGGLEVPVADLTAARAGGLARFL